jgi:hypothetical protein
LPKTRAGMRNVHGSVHALEGDSAGTGRIWGHGFVHEMHPPTSPYKLINIM